MRAMPNLNIIASRIDRFALQDLSRLVRNIGINAFIAAFAIATVQGGLALLQYRSNPNGELSVPPGITYGIEDFSNSTKEPDLITLMNDYPDQMQISKEKTSTFEAETENLPGRVSTFFSDVNKLLVLLIPWVSNQLTFILKKRIHLLHVGFIMSLVSILDLRPREMYPLETIDNLHQFCGSKENINLVVIGDSFACGIGSVSLWDKEKGLAPFRRIENMKESPTLVNEKLHDKLGPVFPKSFARTLSHRIKRPVNWRSAGVDGGDVVDINTYCVGVIEDEVKKGRSPDVVVILCGMNDLKKMFVKPVFAGLAFDFRSNLTKLIQSIQKHAPDTKILFPAIPSYKLEKDSVLNILPLSFFLDVMISLWDWQKKRVADSLSSSVMYLHVTGKEIGKWYKTFGTHERGSSSNTLISADGVHPNSRGYAQWGKCMANKFCSQLETSSVKSN